MDMYIILLGLFAFAQAQEEYHLPEVEGYDGWYNNLAHPEWGGADMPLSRRLTPVFSDGTYQPSGKGRPNPLDIAEATMRGAVGRTSYLNRTALLVFFGQQVVEEVLDAQRPGCPPEYFNIPIPTGHRLYDPRSEGGKFIPFLRSRYDKNTGQSPNNVRQQLNEITPWIDGGLTYGITKAWADALRAFENGELKCRGSVQRWDCDLPARNDIGLPIVNPPPPADHQLKSARRFFRIGNPRGNENPMLLTMQVLWFRNHNWHANDLIKYFEKSNVTVNDEILFNRARQLNIAEHQHIILDEWLPAFLGSPIPAYDVYSSTTFPGVTHIFQSAAMRFGHTIVPPIAYRAFLENKSGTMGCTFRPLGGEENVRAATAVTTVRTCQSYFNSPDIINNGQGVEELLFGLSRQVSEREDNIITEDLQGFVFGALDFSRRDLMALNIQRGRDHGLPDYNTARVNFNLTRLTSFEEINPTVFDRSNDNYEDYNTTREAIMNLEMLHNGSIDDVDIWAGGLLETVDGPGPLFTAVIRDQFLRIRNGDRFWFENTLNGLFTPDEVQTVKNVNFNTILSRVMRATWWNSTYLTKNPFRYDGVEDEMHPTLNANGCAPNTEYTVNSLARNLEPCSPMKTFDYFDGSEGPYIGSFVSLGLYLLINIVVMFVAVRVVKQRAIKAKTTNPADGGADVWLKAGVISTSGGVPMVADELKVSKSRKIVIAPSVSRKQLKVYDAVSGEVVRTVDLAHIKHCDMMITPQGKVLSDGIVLLRFANLYDMVLRFAGSAEPFSNAMNDFLNHIGISTNRRYMPESSILADVFTKEDRQKLVEEFFRLLFRESLAEEGQPRERTNFIGIRRRTTKRKKQILSLELTKAEFAEAMSMKPDTLFVEQVFKLVDDDHSGTVSFQEFLKFLILFTKGSADSKLELMFNIYDIDGSGSLEREEFTEMLGHLIEQANEQVDSDNLKSVVDSMLSSAGMTDVRTMNLQQFKRLFGDYKQELDDAAVQVKGKTARKSTIPPVSAQQLDALQQIAKTSSNGASSEPSLLQVEEEQRVAAAAAPQGRYCSVRRRKVDVAAAAYENQYDAQTSSDVHIEPLPVEAEIGDDAQLSTQADSVLKLQRFWENYRLHIFWVILYQLVVAAIFVERAYYYSVEREHGGLRRIAGYGVTVTRGAASAMMFTYSTLLVTMSRNIITRLRETFLNNYIPFDGAHSMHKCIAFTALIYTITHCIGHAINFYHISTQTANDLTCLFREYYHLSDELPKFQFWMFNTLTGVTGYLLVLVIVTMYIFAMPYARRYLFRTFWITHHLYIVLYILLILHGSGRLVQPPLFQWFFVAPAAIFAIDKLISYSRKKVEIVVYKAEKLPSQVTHLQFKKPSNFDYRSGQWVRIACLSLNESEYHPFTLTSAPGETTLDLHIRAVGPWTQNLRTVYDPENPKNRDTHGALSFPRLYLDGPFGEGHQDWFKYEIAVLVGGGIGVTPFASILKDVVNKQANNARVTAKKVYFLWVTRTQKQFEWMTDIIRQVEEEDKKQLTDIHIFITQFYQKFDLRTIMLYICERHFQKVSNRSLFSGLRSVTHFGRPQFNSFFEGLQELHSNVTQIGVFSCGPPPMTRSVEDGCAHCNQIEGPIFIHHSENF